MPMDILTFFKKYVRVGLLFLLLFTIVLTPLDQYGQVQKAEALDSVVVVGGKGTVQETISAVANKGILALQQSLNYKEYFLDGIAHGLAKMALQSMTQSIVNWINSGFEGRPAFITDLEGFLLERADEIAGDLIYNDPSLNFLCSPFQLDVKVALDAYYMEQTRRDGSSFQCTLSDVSENIDGFLRGNFQDGGWPAWFEVTQNPQNTPTGAYLAAEAELAARIADDEGRTVRELDWGEGFMSFKVCDGSRGAGGSTENCDITTPGAVIANQINKSLGAGQDALIEADEINEIIGALFGQLAQRAITGLNGLLGLGGSQSYSSGGYGPSGNQSYLDAMLEEDIQSEQVYGEVPIERAISHERSYGALHQEVIDAITDAESEIERLNGRYADISCSINIPTPTSLIRERDRAEVAVATSESNIANLQSIEQNYNNAESAEERQVAVEPFLELAADNQIKTEVDSMQLQIEIEQDIDPEIAAFNSQIDRAARTCAEAEAAEEASQRR